MATATNDFAPVRFSTSDLPAKERISFWREFLGRSILHLEFEPPRGVPFFGDKTCLVLPGLAISSGLESACVTSRTPELIAKDGTDDLALLITGVPFFGRQRNRESNDVKGGSFVVLGSEAATVDFQAAGSILTVRIPAAVVRPMLSNFDAVWMSPLPRGGEPLRLLTHYIRMLVSDCGRLTPELARLSVAHIQDLFVLAIGANRDATEIANGRGLRAARLRAIKADITENLADDVSVAAIAARHRLSTRYVHQLFESDGTTLSRFVLGQRLTRVHRMLADPRHLGRTIGDIVYGAGFGDLSTFNREFRRQYGMTPSDVRASARD